MLEARFRMVFFVIGNLSNLNFIPNSGNQTPQQQATPKHQPAATKSPDYSRSHFDPINNKGNNDASKPKAKSDDVFGDLLGSQGYTFTAKKENMPRSINEMRKEELVATMDPETLKINEWVHRLIRYFFLFI